MCGSTCFGRIHAHHQELTTVLTASGFTGFTVGTLVVAALLVVVFNAAITTLQR
jgi:tetrahydromethanopterin S-methyltransferase subunit F